MRDTPAGQACATGDPREVLTRPAELPDVVLRYAAHAEAVVDLFWPPALGVPETPSRLVVLFHGGFWRQEFGRTHLRPLAGGLARRGFVVALPEYRRIGGGGGWPLTGYDVEAALAEIPSAIDGVSPGRIDPAAPCVVAGHSAGGHLALWAGLRAGAAKVAAVVALAPVADLVYGAETRIGDGAVIDLMGGSPADVPDAYADADVLALLTGEVPVTLIQGTDDKQVTVDMNRRLADARGVTYVELEGIEHFALIDPLAHIFEEQLLPALAR